MIPLDDMKFLDWEDGAPIKIASNARHGLPSQLFPMLACFLKEGVRQTQYSSNSILIVILFQTSSRG